MPLRIYFWGLPKIFQNSYFSENFWDVCFSSCLGSIWKASKRYVHDRRWGWDQGEISLHGETFLITPTLCSEVRGETRDHLNLAKGWKQKIAQTRWFKRALFVINEIIKHGNILSIIQMVLKFLTTELLKGLLKQFLMHLLPSSFLKYLRVTSPVASIL